MTSFRSVLAASALSAALLAGCFGGLDDLAPVCERKSGSPWPAYPPEELAPLIRTDEAAPGASRAGEVASAAAPHLITMGGRPAARLDARLVAYRAAGTPAFWRLLVEAENDSYSVVLHDEGGRFVARAETPSFEPVNAPPSIRALALGAANASDDAQRFLGPTTSLHVAGWDPALPSCVHLHYQPGGERIVVNVVRGQVVHLERG